jgi:hypothetical protein
MTAVGLAQSVARRSHNPEVASSSLALHILFRSFAFFQFFKGTWSCVDKTALPGVLDIRTCLFSHMLTNLPSHYVVLVSDESLNVLQRFIEPSFQRRVTPYFLIRCALHT